MKGKVALVTGAASGIGRATALAFARAGARVVVADLDGRHGEETVALIRAERGEASFVGVDVSSSAQVERMVAQTFDAWGRLDVAFNNAGIEGTMASTAELSESEWDRVIAVNLKGIWLCMRHEIPRMLAGGGGAIVNCSSVAGLIGFAGEAAYVASKHGIVGLTKTAALEYARSGIRINAVCPGVIDTPMIERATAGKPELAGQLVAGQPIGRLGRPEEIAAAVLWLASDAASFVTGAALPVDGGWVAR
jgi:NAD(P)-dependent dehydrogenase (short-subunit alcohol dehydrogenase family)